MSEKRVLAKKSDITYFGDVVRSKKGINNSLSLEQVKQGVSELKGDSDEWQGDFKNQGNVLFNPQEYNGEYIEEGDNLTVPSGTIEITENGEYNVSDKEFARVNCINVIEVDELPEVNSVNSYVIYGKKYYSDIVIYYNEQATIGSLIAPCYGIEAVDELPTSDMFYTVQSGEYVNAYYYFLKSEKQLYLFYKIADSVTLMTVEEFISNVLGENLSFKGEVFIKNIYEIQTNGFSLVYKYDYYMSENYIVNGEIIQRWISINKKKINKYYYSANSSSVTLQVSIGDYVENDFDVNWFVNKVPIRKVWSSKDQTSGYQYESLTINEIFSDFGAGTFDITVIFKDANAGAIFEDIIATITITIDENGNYVEN